MLVIFEGVTQVGARAQIERQLNDREDIQVISRKWPLILPERFVASSLLIASYTYRVI